MKQQANLIRAGQVIEHDGRRWTVLKQQIITPGKGGASHLFGYADAGTGGRCNGVLSPALGSTGIPHLVVRP